MSQVAEAHDELPPACSDARQSTQARCYAVRRSDIVLYTSLYTCSYLAVSQVWARADRLPALCMWSTQVGSERADIRAQVLEASH